MDKDVRENAHNKKAGRQERNLSFNVGSKEIVLGTCFRRILWS
jgi:hypothetical protein